MRKQAILGIVLAALAATPALSEEKPMPAACLEQKTASIHVNFNISGPDAAGLREKFNAGIEKIQSLASGIGVTKMNAAGKNYFIHAQPGANMGVVYDSAVVPPQLGGGTAYMLSGNVNFIMEPASKSLEMLGLLQKNNYSATLSFVEANKAAGVCRLNVATGEWE